MSWICKTLRAGVQKCGSAKPTGSAVCKLAGLWSGPVIKGHKITQRTTAGIIFSQCFHSDRELSINVIYESQRRPMKINAREEKSAQCKSAIKINICAARARAHAPINRRRGYLRCEREINKYTHVCDARACALMGEQTSGKQMHAQTYFWLQLFNIFAPVNTPALDSV